MRKHRAKLSAQDFEPVVIWLPDINSPEFQLEARRQSLLASRCRKGEADALDFIEAAFDDQ